MRRTYLISAVVFWAGLGLATPSQAVLVGHWEFEETSGAIAANSIVGGADGVVTNDATGGLGAGGSVWVNDPSFGNVISFNGEADGAFVRAGDLPELLTLENDFSWAFLANNQSTEVSSIIVGNRTDGGSPEEDFSPRQFAKFTPNSFNYHMNGNSNDRLSYPTMPVEEWRHHALVKEGEQLTYHLNGLPRASSVITQAQDQIMPLFFGGDSTGNPIENWQGFLDDVRIYDNALTANDVRSIVPGTLLETFGDVNGDGDVTVNEDFEPIRANFLRQVTTREEGDLTKDGVVNLDDWNEFKTAFLNNGGSLADLTASGAAPEPSALMLLAVLTSASSLRRRR